MMKLHHDESPKTVSVDVRKLIQSQHKSEENNDTIEFPISQENVILELDQNEKLLHGQNNRSEIDNFKWNTNQLFTGPSNPVLDLKQEYLMEDNQQSGYDANILSEHLSDIDDRQGGRLEVDENRINEVSEEKPISSTNGIEKIKRPKFSCKDCSFIGINKYDIIRHRRQIHLGPPTKRHQCNQCDFSTVWKSNYNIHMQRHGEATFKCDYCEHKCHTRVDLENHIRRHLDENAFKCDQCDYSGSSIYALNRHKQRHTTERNFICLECSKAFKTMRCLSRHQKIHSDIRPYVCEYCDKKFYKNDKLKVHLRIHTGERPYKCDQCDYAAVTRGNLKKHQNNKHKIHEVQDITPFMPIESYQKANSSI